MSSIKVIVKSLWFVYIDFCGWNYLRLNGEILMKFREGVGVTTLNIH